MNKTALITGATSGFGAACARLLAAEGWRLLLNGRRSERLEALKQELNTTEVHTLPFDVRDRAAVNAAIEGLPEAWADIDLLVNNAGLALGRDAFGEASVDDWDTMIDTNVKGLLYVSRAIVPRMQVRRRGHIINIGSIAGKEVYEKGSVYCASKSAVDALNRAMRIDLLPYGIRVTGIHPGAAETEFSLVRFKGDAATAEKVYEGFRPLSAEDVAEVVRYAASLPAHMCINDLVLTPTQQANAYHFNRNGR